MARSRTIGLDIGTSAVRAAELEFGSGGAAGASATLVALAEQPLPPGAVTDGEVREPEAVATAIRQVWRSGKFSSKNVVIGIGNQRVLVRELELPWLPLDQLKKSLPYQAQELLPVAADEALLDFYPTAEGVTGTERTVTGMFVAAVKDTVVANVVAAEGAGTLPVRVDLNAFALVRALTRGDLLDRTAAFIDIGARVTNLVIARRGLPVFVRIIPHGGQDVTDAVAAALQLSATEAEKTKREVGLGFSTAEPLVPAADAVTQTTRPLIEGIRNSLLFYAGQLPDNPVEVVVLTGGGSMLRGLGQFLSSATRLPAMLGNPLEGLKLAKSVDSSLTKGREHLLAVSVGLAQGEAA